MAGAGPPSKYGDQQHQNGVQPFQGPRVIRRIGLQDWAGEPGGINLIGNTCATRGADDDVFRLQTDLGRISPGRVRTATFALGCPGI